MLRATSALFLVAALCAMLSFPVRAQAPATADPADLAELSIEELMNVSVTSVSKKRTPLGESAAAIAVITQEDIRRSGYTTLPELLRFVPGLTVARINGNEWAITSRGFNSQYANKLLVLVDGRTVYTPSSAGVFWNAQDVVLEDVDRIEVIRGPGATLWGANAVNGVINIITKSARDTQGALLSAAVGSEDVPSAGARYGGRAGSTLYYRAYARHFNREPLVDGNGNDLLDEWDSVRGGVRLDWQPRDNDALTLQTDWYTGTASKPITLASPAPPYVNAQNVVEDNRGGNVLGRWTRTFSPSSQLDMQVYYDRVREGHGFGVEYHDTYDLDVQHRFALGARNDVVWGVGFRYNTLKETSSFGLTWTPERLDLRLFEAFLQDDFTLQPDRWHLILGSKVEHNNFTGFELQPSMRLLWTPREDEAAWAAISRATRTPSMFDRTHRMNVAVFQPPASPPIWVSLLGNADVQEEKLLAYEIGYRFAPLRSLSFDVAAFYNVYRDLMTWVDEPPSFEVTPGPPHVLLASSYRNALRAETYGAELSAQWQVMSRWRITGSYSGLRMHVRPDPTVESESPQQQAQLRSLIELPARVELNAAVLYMDSISVNPTGTPTRIPAYVRLDLGAIWRATDTLEIGVWGQNLLEHQHPEFPSVQTSLQTEVPRSVLARVNWRL